MLVMEWKTFCCIHHFHLDHNTPCLLPPRILHISLGTTVIHMKNYRGGAVNKENCVVPKTIHTPHGGDFSFRPPTPGFSVIFQLDQAPPGKNSYINNAFALYYLCESLLFLREKNPFIHVNSVCNHLEFALETSFLVNN